MLDVGDENRLDGVTVDAGSHLFRARKLRAGFAEKPVLKGVSFDVRHLKNTVILGPGGSGKTTLLRVMADVNMPPQFWSKGDVHNEIETACCWLEQKYGGHQKDFSLYDFFLSQVHPSIPDSGYLQNLMNLIKTIPDEGPHFLENMDKDLSFFSKEQLRLAYFCSVLMSGCSFWMWDEPEFGQKSTTQKWMIEQLQKERGKRTIVVVTHNIAFAKALADWVILLINGEICEQGPAQEFFESPRLPRTEHYIRMGS